MSAEGGAKAIVAAFAANLGIAVSKFVGFLLTGSAALLAESVHSLADTGNQGLLLLGRRRGRRAADTSHEFGYGRERYFWAFVVALVLFSLGALFSVYEGVHKLQHPEPVSKPLVGLTILAVAVLLESASLRTALVEAHALRGSQSLTKFIRTTKNPELPTVLLEDIGALVGLVLALVAFVLAWRVNPIWDGVGSLAIGAVLAVIATILAVEMKSLLIGEAVTPADRAAIEAAVAETAGVDSLIHLRTEHIGPEQILVATKLAFAPTLQLAELADAIDRVEAEIRRRVPNAELIYIEPDLRRSIHHSTDPAR
jgi:cation diffusion facilitator family transporter